MESVVEIVGRKLQVETGESAGSAEGVWAGKGGGGSSRVPQASL